ncbi:acyltransferase [Streptomyces sp. DH37]|uniref:acyltransferase family protein n=1 Tax=Streptomyces sp. DH37 TaxID=3040122 RepID=UPI002442973F|nr:acyltransferase [Streptomyces sp. DH37]MDG9704731.1 acyltransferase [Streptomyces sp. DH37]
MSAPTRIPEAEAVRPRLPSLTSLRFFAAMLVFLCHAGFVAFFNQPAYRDDFVSLVNKAGAVGVSFFFVLSGFVLAWSSREGDTVPRFWRRRLFKIYPLHVATFVLAMAVTAWSTATWGTSLMNLFLVQTWAPRADVAAMVNIPSWSLSCELLFYLSFPWLFRALRGIRPERLWWWAGGVTAAVFCVPLVARALPASPLMPRMGGPVGDPVSQWETWFVYAFPPVRMLEFTLGILLALIVLNGRWVRMPVTGLLALTAVAYAVALNAPFGLSLVAVSIIPVALLIPATAQIDIEGRASVLRNRTLVWLGEISFAFYMVHSVVMALFGELIPQGALGTWATTGLIALDLAVSILAAWALYAGLERPVMRRWSRPRARRAEAPAAVAQPLSAPPVREPVA